MQGNDKHLRDRTRTFIRELAALCQWEPTQLARHADLAPSTINRFLNDDEAKHVISTKTMAKILQAVMQRMLDLEDEDPAGTEGRQILWQKLTAANASLLPYGIAPGYTPDGETPPGAMFTVQEIQTQASAGGGAIVEAENGGEVWGFPSDWARVELRAGQNELRIVTIVGDSMANPDDPLCLFSGDKVVVNIGLRTPSPPGAFVIWDGLGLVAKRAEIVPNSDPPRVKISSANRAYEPYERTIDEAHIVGRILGAWRRL